MELITGSVADLDQAVAELLRFAGGRRLFTFSGEIGAGKTTLIQAFCRALGVEEAVTSPTFALVNEYGYVDPTGAPGTIYHLDLYRLTGLQEALDIGIEEILAADDAYRLIEWPEIIEPLLPPDAVRIKLEIVPGSGRKILFL